MAPPTDESRPRLATGTRWASPTTGGADESRMIVFPEGAIKLQGTGRQVLERCDGQRTFGEIVADLQQAITEFLEAWNEDPKPFLWTATVDSIQAKLARCRQTLEQITPGCTAPRTRKKRRIKSPVISRTPH